MISEKAANHTGVAVSRKRTAAPIMPCCDYKNGLEQCVKVDHQKTEPLGLVPKNAKKKQNKTKTTPLP